MNPELQVDNSKFSVAPVSPVPVDGSGPAMGSWVQPVWFASALGAVLPSAVGAKNQHVIRRMRVKLSNEPLAAALPHKILAFIQFFIRLRTRSVDLAPTSPTVLSTFPGFADSSPGISAPDRACSAPPADTCLIEPKHF